MTKLRASLLAMCSVSFHLTLCADSNDVNSEIASKIKSLESNLEDNSSSFTNKLESKLEDFEDDIKNLDYNLQSSEENTVVYADFPKLERNNKTRIHGGTQRRRPIPWQVLIIHSSSSEAFCGGALIDDSTILSAAHCFDPILSNGDNPLEWIYAVGQISKNPEYIGGIAEIMIHESYSNDTHNNDIALLKTLEPIRFTRWVQPISLPPSQTTGRCVVSGWGATNTIQVAEQNEAERISSDILQIAEVSLIPIRQCYQIYANEGKEDFITSKKVCTTSYGGNKERAPCFGDSGGPLACSNFRGQAILVGIVSGGAGCGIFKYPAVYTKVRRYLNWILPKMGRTDQSYCRESPDGLPICAPPEYCVKLKWKGDGNCDDENNTPACDYDGGDCCTDERHKYCDICECKDPNFIRKKKCKKPKWIGDNNCDDGNNHEECDFDGGDCCTDTKHLYCTICECKERQNKCPHPSWMNDGHCDFENDIEECNYDGGDCIEKSEEYPLIYN